MKFDLKKRFLIYFLFTLSFLLVEKVFFSETAFVTGLIYGMNLILIGLIIYRTLKKSEWINRRLTLKLFYFLLLAVSLFNLQYKLKSYGTYLFIIYLFFLLLLKIPPETTIYIAIVSLASLPMLALGQFNATAGTMADFSFLLLFTVTSYYLFLFKKGHGET